MEPGLSQLRRGVLEYCVLALLRDGERYAFELVRDLADTEGLVTSEGTLYPLLSRLRREQLVETTWRESSAGPPRRYYSLTAHGTSVLDAFTDRMAPLLTVGRRAALHPDPRRDTDAAPTR